MKKIISLLAATMMMFSFAVVSHAAGENTTISIDQKNVALNASGDDAKVAVNYTFDFGGEMNVMGLTTEITYDTSALTLDSYSLSGGVTWGGTDVSIKKTAYGAYLYFEDSSYAGTLVDNLVLTVNYTVNDTTTAKELDLGIQKYEVVDADSYSSYSDFTIVKAGKISVAAASAPQSFNAKVAYGAKAQAAEGIKFNLTTNDATKNVKTVDYSVPFFAENADKSGIENIGNIAVGLTINGVPSGVAVTANSAELY